MSVTKGIKGDRFFYILSIYISYNRDYAWGYVSSSFLQQSTSMRHAILFKALHSCILCIMQLKHTTS